MRNPLGCIQAVPFGKVQHRAEPEYRLPNAWHYRNALEYRVEKRTRSETAGDVVMRSAC